MNDEELQKELLAISEELDKLSGTETPLTKTEKRRKHILSLQKSTLLKLKKAREQGERNTEQQQIAMYGMLSACKDKHPIFLHFARMKMGINL